MNDVSELVNKVIELRRTRAALIVAIILCVLFDTHQILKIHSLQARLNAQQEILAMKDGAFIRLINRIKEIQQ